jgi:hypothetical protein
VAVGASGIDWPTRLDHPSTPETHRAAALHALDASGMQTMMDDLIKVSLDQQLEQNPMLQPYREVMLGFLRKYLSYAAIRDELGELYLGKFDELQLRQLAAFYATDTGRVANSKIPELMKLGGEVGRRRVAEHQEELMKLLQDAMAKQKQP